MVTQALTLYYYELPLINYSILSRQKKSTISNRFDQQRMNCDLK